MKKTNFKLFSLLTFFGLSITTLTGCGSIGAKTEGSSHIETTEHNNEVVVPEREIGHKVPEGKYNPSAVLVKTKNLTESKLDGINYKNYEQLYKGSDWYKVTLEIKDEEVTQRIVRELEDSEKFDDVDFDYLMGADALDLPVEVSMNPYAVDQQTYLETSGVLAGWKHKKEKGLEPGGSRDVVVAVIDTGVDYNHPDLINNIWCNPGEIPDDGVDNDNNGYVDDYHGYDFVGDDKDPIDDNGHGTHVAGIIAAENNLEGTVGVAYNSQIMCVKAGNSSGYFNSSDIAEAITYAYMNGASVINMSFGGYALNDMVEEALENAYDQSILVAASGNDGYCNNTSKEHYNMHGGKVGEMYPASLSYVIGVASSNQSGTKSSVFSNYDDTPYNHVEYETYAPGEQIISTWPNNRYAKLSGTSMAAPVVSGIAALLRADLKDREVYSNKYIQSQIVNTGDLTLIGEHTVANYYNALTKLPKPHVSFNQKWTFDNKEFSPLNNGDGIIDAGETIRLGIELLNRGGVAKNVDVYLNTHRDSSGDIVDPYIKIKNDHINLGDIGTYSRRDGGRVYDENRQVIGFKTYFEIVIDSKCPNEYLCNFNIGFSYGNGLDENDKTIYRRSSTFGIVCFSAEKLLGSYTTNTTLTKDKHYIMDKNVVISEGVTLNIEAGTEITLIDEINAYNRDLVFILYGTLNINGTKDNPVLIHQSSIAPTWATINKNPGNSVLKCNWLDSIGLSIDDHNGSSTSDLIANSSFYSRNFTASGAKNCMFKNIDRLFLNDCSECCIVYTIGNASIDLSSCRNITFNYDVPVNGYDSKSYLYLYDSCYNIFFNDGFPNSNSLDNFLKIVCQGDYRNKVQLAGNGRFIKYKEKNIVNLYDEKGVEKLEFNSSKFMYDQLPAYAKEVNILDSSNHKISKVGAGEFKVQIKFNRKMQTSDKLDVKYGSRTPYADYKVNGNWIDSTTWEGTATNKAFIENGTQRLGIKNGHAVGNDFLTNDMVGIVHEFDIDTTSTMSMNLSASNNEDGSVKLSWVQDDYNTLMGYNVYRSEEKNGNYVRLNNSVIPSSEHTFVDKEALPGKNYWYTFTVVLSDMSESKPAGKVSCTTLDTVDPRIYHTPVNQAYVNNNLVISCTASDNVGVVSAKLNYRTKGETSYKTIDMARNNDKYSATIFGSEINIAGLQYYIEVNDGVNTITKGSKNNPYDVVVKDASSISRLGDVDGDSRITSKDALMIMQSLEGKIILTDDQFKRADLNKDGVLSAAEALRILQYINGNVSSLEMN